ncbi:LysR family transcriptional regulator [Promicromonospora sp. NPDC057488]|uniref:LysR family transcriptional regulator n=1 Tax=Promicromonospora sp. NPDC057488 TaxID=3346147 RepID=UPI00366CC1DE
MRITQVQLASFVAIVEHGSVTSAARHLRYSPSSVSAHMSSLERGLGSQLVRRVGGAYVATEAGQYVLRLSRQVLDGYGRLDDVRANGIPDGAGR